MSGLRDSRQNIRLTVSLVRTSDGSNIAAAAEAAIHDEVAVQ